MAKSVVKPNSAQPSGEPDAVASIETVRVEAWKEYPWLRHGFSTRMGGVTDAYRQGGDDKRLDLNLGFTPHDVEENVLENRRRFLAELISGDGQNSIPKLVTLRQVHSTQVLRVDGTHAADRAVLSGDGLMTDEPGVVLGIQTADCIPVLIADRRSHAVAAFHAGWRGTVNRIVEAGVGKMRLEFGSNPADLIAAIGPGIGQCCYAIGEEVLHEFQSQFSYADELFREIYDSDPIRNKYPMLFLSARAPGHSDIGPQLHLDLAEANRRQLLDAGLLADSISVVGECSSCLPDRYFSHRGERGFAGRMLSGIGAIS
jgi:YfiH family protein